MKGRCVVNVHTSYIAQVKWMCGQDMGENYNKSKKENTEAKQCSQEKVEYIKDALRHYKNYENVNFLPISDNVDCKYTVYVGNNGVGKSGIFGCSIKQS